MEFHFPSLVVFVAGAAAMVAGPAGCGDSSSTTPGSDAGVSGDGSSDGSAAGDTGSVADAGTAADSGSPTEDGAGETGPIADGDTGDTAPSVDAALLDGTSDGGEATEAGAGDADAGAVFDAGFTFDGSLPFDAGGLSCAALVQVLNQLRPAAQACVPASNPPPCQFAAKDLCCPISVDNNLSPAVVVFEQAVAAFNAAKCGAVCPAILCLAAPSKTCDSQTAMCLP
jgi:hypothetical protein